MFEGRHLSAVSGQLPSDDLTRLTQVTHSSLQDSVQNKSRALDGVGVLGCQWEASRASEPGLTVSRVYLRA